METAIISIKPACPPCPPIFTKMKLFCGVLSLDAVVQSFIMGIPSGNIKGYYKTWWEKLFGVIGATFPRTIESRLGELGFKFTSSNAQSEEEGFKMLKEAMTKNHPVFLLIKADGGTPHWVTVWAVDTETGDIYIYDSSTKIPEEKIAYGNRKINYYRELWEMWKDDEPQGKYLLRRGPHFFIEATPPN